jgi:cyclase
MLVSVVQRIQELRRAGKSDTEIRAAKPSAEFDARFGAGFVKPEAFVQMMLGVMTP